MRLPLIAVLLLLPAVASASECQFEAPRQLSLNLQGVHRVQIELHSQDLQLQGAAPGRHASLSARACASDKATLAQLQVTQRREGDQLWLDVGGDPHFSFSLFGHSYASLKVKLQLPVSMPVTVNVGSGDATVSGMQQLQGDVGSGDLHVMKLTGQLQISVGSGDIDAADIGSLYLGSVGSGDFRAHDIRGDARVGSIGSGDVILRTVGGNVHADTLGSGDLKVSDVSGDFTLAAKGSGEVSSSGVGGKVNVPRDDD